MKQLVQLLVLASLVVTFSGCGGNPKGKVGTPSSLALPAEFPIVAEAIAMPLKSSQEAFRGLPRVEANAEIQGWISSLETVKSEDADITSIATQGHDSFRGIVARIERLNSLPHPPGFLKQLSTSMLGGFYSGLTRDPKGIAVALSSTLDNQSKEDALISEIRGLIGAFDKADTVHLLWPRIAQKYAATPSDSDGRIVVDVDAAWGPIGPHDWLKIFNKGPIALENCTVQVLLMGQNGQSRKNVHFVRHWPANSWVYARYEVGGQLLDRKDIFQTTIPELQKAEISLWSPQYTTTLTYLYQGNEKDKDIAKWCQNLKLSGRYQPFVSGYAWNTERGVEFTLDGIDSIPAYHADVEFRKGSTSKTWSWDHEGWTNGETKQFSSPKGELSFDPSCVDFTLSFPGTNYKYKATLNMK